MTLYLMKTRLNFTSNFLDQNTPNLNVSARMSWSISVVWSFSKNSQSCIKNSRQSRQFLNLINYTLLLVLETAHNKINNDPQWLLIIAAHCFEEPQLLLLDMHLWRYHHNLSILCPYTGPNITRNRSKQIFINISGIKTSLMLKMLTYS